MYWHLAAYAETTAGAVTNDDMAAPDDGILQRRNSHLILSDPFRLIGWEHIGATTTRARFANPSMIVNGIHHCWPLEVSATQPDEPKIVDYRDTPIDLPLDEEITIEHTMTAAGGDQNTSLLFLASPQWNRNFPPHSKRLTVRATVVIAAGTENTFGAAVAVVMERDLLQGVYSVIGANVVAASAIAFRIHFPSQRIVNGRQLRPGAPVQNATNLRPSRYFDKPMGEWGRFHTFELPSISVLSDAAGGTYEVRLDLLYLGRERSLLWS